MLDDAYQWLDEMRSRVVLDDVMAHRWALEHAARGVTEERRSSSLPSMDALLKVLSRARHHVHFMTWGLSAELLGALKLLSAMGIEVNGLVSNAQDYMIRDLKEHRFEALYLTLVPFSQSESWGKPHVKLIEVDGLMAFTGSANLTMTAWRKADTDGELINVVTDEAEVVRIHNRYFSSAWLKYGKNDMVGDPKGNVIEMWD